MTRQEWYEHYREERIERKKRYINWGSGLKAMFKEYYGCILYDKDRVKYDLICKYENQVSYRLIQEKNKLIEKGKENSDKMFNDIIQNPLQVSKFLPKDNIYHQPVLLKYRDHFGDNNES